MKTIATFIALLASLPSMAFGFETETESKPLELKQRILLADVVAVAKVKSIEVVHRTDNFEYQKVTCILENILKGKIRDNRKEVEVILNLQLKKFPNADQLHKDGKYILFLNGTWSYEPITPTDGIFPLADSYKVANDTFTHEKLLSRIGELIKTGPRIREVGISVNTASGWGANFRVHSGGRTNGSHISGGELPFVHMEKGTIEAKPLEEILVQADKAYDSKAQSLPVISTTNIVIITIEPFIGKTTVYQRKIKEAFKDKELVELDRLLHKHRIGAW